MRACGGRSGSELGPDKFRELLFSGDYAGNDSNEDSLAELLKSRGVAIFDLGNIRKYQLSKFKAKQDVESGEKTYLENSFTELYRFVLTKVPNSKIILIGGSDDVCRSVY